MTGGLLSSGNGTLIISAYEVIVHIYGESANLILHYLFIERSEMNIPHFMIKFLPPSDLRINKTEKCLFFHVLFQMFKV